MPASLEHQERMLKHLEGQTKRWAPAVKRQLGDVFHLVRFGSSAHCNRNVRLAMAQAENGKPLLSYCCKRCSAIETMIAKEEAAYLNPGVTQEVG